MGYGRYSEVEEGKWATPPQEGTEYETIDVFGVLCLNNDLQSIIRSNYLCNNYGWILYQQVQLLPSLWNAIEKAYYLSNQQVDNLDRNWGNSDVIVDLVHKIAKREGIGNLLAEGTAHIAEQIGHEAQKIVLYTKGMELLAHETKGKVKIHDL